MVVAKIELKADWYRWDNGAYIAPFFLYPAVSSSPNYVSLSGSMGLSGTITVRAQAHNKHTCEYGHPQFFPYKFSDPMVVVT